MGSLVNSLFGRGGSGIANQGIQEGARRAEQSYFRPYTVTTGTGTSGYQNGQLTAALSPELAALQGSAFGTAGQFLPQLAALASQSPNMFGYQSPLLGQAEQLAMQAPQQFAFTPDIASRQQEIFEQTSAQLQPQFAQQATQLQQGLFGSGRLGLRLSGESAGLGAGSGMVQPDALGLGRAQQQTLAGLATQARQQALGEEAQRYQQSLGTFGTNVAQQQQQLQNLLGTQAQGFGQAAQGFGMNEAQRQQQFANMLGLQQGLFGQGTALSGLEQALMAQGLDAETARAAAAYGAGNLALSPYNTAAQIAQQQRGQNADFFGALAGAAATAKASDVRLKENINPLDTLSNGINIYTWDWNNIAKVMGVDNHPRVGVIAQEIAGVIPEAVFEHSNGYLMVDYNHPALQGVH